MGAVIMVFRAELRRRWKAWLALAVLIGFVGGLVLAFTAAGRRTASAYPAFIAAHGYDLALQAQGPVPHLRSLPEVESATEAISAVTGQPRCACTVKIDLNGFSVLSVPRRGLARMASLVAGRMPDPSSPDQVLASFTMQQDDGVHVGTILHVPLYASSQFNAVANATGALPKPTGPRLALHVVGIEAAETEFPIGATSVYDVYATRAFARQVLPHTAQFPTYFVSLRGGANDIARFKSDVGITGIGGTEVLDTQAELVASSIHPQAVGWWLLAVLTALAGLAMVGQAISRQSRVEGEEYETLRVLGLTPGQVVGLGMARASRSQRGRRGQRSRSRVPIVASCSSGRGTFCRDIDRSFDRPPRPSDGLSGHDRRCSPCRGVAVDPPGATRRPPQQHRARTIPVRQTPRLGRRAPRPRWSVSAMRSTAGGGAPRCRYPQRYSAPSWPFSC